MRKIAGPGHSSNRFADYDAVTNPTGTVVTDDWANDVQDELIGIQEDMSISEAAGTNEYILAAIKGLAIKHSKRVGEIFTLDTYEDPAAFDEDDPESFFPALCLDTIDGEEDISSANWPDLVTHLRAKVFKYNEGIAATEKSVFDVTDWAIVSNVATLTFANTTAENAILAALAEENLVHGSYTDWRSITLAGAIGDITAGEYAITDVDAAARTISFAFTAGDNSGAVTATVNFYQHRIPGSTTTARVFEMKGRTIVSANDADGENIAGMMRRDHGQKITGDMGLWGADRGVVETGSAIGAFTASGSHSYAPGGASSGAADKVVFDSSKTIDAAGTGTENTRVDGDYTEPRSLAGHIYIWAKTYTA